MKKIGIYELRKSCLSKSFASIFPDKIEYFESYWKKPGCGKCWRTLYKEIAPDIEKARSYFGDDVEFIITDVKERVNEKVESSFHSFSCNVEKLQSRIDDVLRSSSGIPSIMLARWEDEVTAVISLMNTESNLEIKHMAFNTDTDGVQEILQGIDSKYQKQRQVSICRYENKITMIVSIFF
jgi:lipopolysaccharide biosynthesis protein